MTTDEYLLTLVLQWEEFREAGKEASAEELCIARPELTQELQKRIDSLTKLDWVDKVQVGPSELEQRGYQLLEKIGRGGGSAVWKASGPQGLVALKFVPVDASMSGAELRAINIIKGVSHPNLLKPYEAWQTDEHLIIAMELAEGTVQQRFEQEKAAGRHGIPRKELLGYLSQAAEGLDYLHSRGITHRDIKPQNLLLIESTLKIADFGLIRELTQTITGHTGLMTMAYAAPEFFQGETSRASDQYSLAVTYCQLRSGELPFDGNPAQIMAGHLSKPPALDMLPQPERSVVARALNKKPEKRFTSCAEFIRALHAGEPTPRPPIRKSALCVGVLLSLILIVLISLLIGFDKDSVVQAKKSHPEATLQKDVGLKKDENRARSKPGEQQPLTDQSHEKLKSIRWLQDTFNGKAGRVVVSGNGDISIAISQGQDDFFRKMKALDSLTSLQISGSKVTDEGLKQIRNLTTLQLCSLVGTGITDAGIVYLEENHNLTSLYLCDTAVSDLGLQYIGKMASLREVHFQRTKITDKGIRNLVKLPRLHLLRLDETSITDEALKDVGRIRSLELLGIADTGVTDKGIKYLEGLRHLRNLSVDTNISLAALTELRKAAPDLSVYDNHGRRILP